MLICGFCYHPGVLKPEFEHTCAIIMLFIEERHLHSPPIFFPFHSRKPES